MKAAFSPIQLKESTHVILMPEKKLEVYFPDEYNSVLDNVCVFCQINLFMKTSGVS